MKKTNPCAPYQCISSLCNYRSRNRDFINENKNSLATLLAVGRINGPTFIKDNIGYELIKYLKLSLADIENKIIRENYRENNIIKENYREPRYYEEAESYALAEDDWAEQIRAKLDASEVELPIEFSNPDQLFKVGEPEKLEVCHPSKTKPGTKCLTYRIFSVPRGDLKKGTKQNYKECITTRTDCEQFIKPLPYDPFTITNNNTADWGGEIHYVRTTTEGKKPPPKDVENILVQEIVVAYTQLGQPNERKTWANDGKSNFYSLCNRGSCVYKNQPPAKTPTVPGVINFKTSNKDTGNWFSWPFKAECKEGQELGEKGCKWKQFGTRRLVLYQPIYDSFMSIIGAKSDADALTDSDLASLPGQFSSQLEDLTSKWDKTIYKKTNATPPPAEEIYGPWSGVMNIYSED